MKMTQPCLTSNTGEPQHGHQYLMLPGTTQVICCIFLCCSSLIRLHAACAWLLSVSKGLELHGYHCFAALLTLLSCGTNNLSDINKIRRLLVVTSPQRSFSNQPVSDLEFE